MKTTSPILRAAILALPLLALAPARAQPIDIDAAHEAYAQGHYDRAYAGFSRLADAGHADAARIAWLMHRHGERLYGRPFEATPYQQLNWAWRWQCGSACEPVVVAQAGC
jgi:hypothetical protein